MKNYDKCCFHFLNFVAFRVFSIGLDLETTTNTLKNYLLSFTMVVLMQMIEQFFVHVETIRLHIYPFSNFSRK
jgi:hypothetical protein